MTRCQRPLRMLPEALRKAVRVLGLLAVSALLLPGAEPGTLVVHRTGDRTWVLEWQGKTYRCAVGRNGVAPSGGKREGDGRTPAGTFPLRELFYRADRIDPGSLRTDLPATALSRDDGWCDAPADANYNRRVRTPYPASHEELWRDKDALYDLIVPIGYNDAPPVPGLGSAIFLHVAGRGYPPTAGCVALSKDDLLAILPSLGPRCRISIVAPEP